MLDSVCEILSRNSKVYTTYLSSVKYRWPQVPQIRARAYQQEDHSQQTGKVKDGAHPILSAAGRDLTGLPCLPSRGLVLEVLVSLASAGVCERPPLATPRRTALPRD